eukprot:scpid109117/ scgid8855/ 
MLKEAKKNLKEKESAIMKLDVDMTELLQTHQELVEKCSRAQRMLRYYKEGKQASQEGDDSSSGAEQNEDSLRDAHCAAQTQLLQSDSLGQIAAPEDQLEDMQDKLDKHSELVTYEDGKY